VLSSLKRDWSALRLARAHDELSGARLVAACGVMRVLFSTTAGTGHFGPLIPFAKACTAAGHTVAVAAPGSFADAVTGAGFRHLAVSEPPAERIAQAFAGIQQLSFEEANRVVLVELFGRLYAHSALSSLSTIMTDWRPDVVLRESGELASVVAADSAGIGQLEVAISMGLVGPGIIQLLQDPLAELSTMADLPADRGAELMLGGATLTSVPQVLDDDLALGQPRPTQPKEQGRIWRFRTDRPIKARLPAVWGGPADPLIYVSYGSVTARQPEFAPIYHATLRALADLPVRVLMTTGRGLDVAELEPIPPNTRVEQWWPQEAVMGEAAAAIGHGGFGTTMAALAAGVPQVVLPLFSFDQTLHAQRVAEVKAGIHLAGGLAAVADLPAALGSVLDDAAFIEGARAMAAEIAALPDVAECLPLLEQLASEKDVRR
jgi:UDP:flavonoid glycosyltransferase YjiC (YdhE family)